MTFDFAGSSPMPRRRGRSCGLDRRLGHGVEQARGRTGQAGRQGGRGYSCIAELRMIETIERIGKPTTPFLRFGDQVRIEMKDPYGHSIFGAIEQQVINYGREA